MNYPKFIHLHVRSDYSIKDGLAKIKQILKKSLLLDMPAIAITDFNNIFSLIKFYKLANKLGLKAIIGVDLKIKNFENINSNKYSMLTILAMNNIGLQNIKLLIFYAYKSGYNNDLGPTITYKLLKKYNEGLIILSGGLEGEIGKNFLKKNFFLVNKIIKFFKNYFYNCFYFEITRINCNYEENYINYILNLSNYFNIPIVATNNVRFLNKKDFYPHEIRVAINKGYNLNKSYKKSNYSKEQFLKNTEEMCFLFRDIPEALQNSVEIAKRCNVFLSFGQYFLPKFYIKKNITPEKYIIKKSYIGLEKKLKKLYPELNLFKIKKNIYKKRLNHELNIINKMGFPSYFLIVMEFVQWAKDHNIPVGPARGSGAGSLVSYVLGITNLDPIKFDLIFERFLNTERISLPDFDIDFCMEKRDLVINHVKKIYGKESVFQIITFGTMTAKSVIRDVGRVLGYPYDFINRISKLIPFDLGINLKKAFMNNKKLSNLYQSDTNIRELVHTSLKLEGTIKNVGKHAGGVVISPEDIIKYTTIYCDYNGENIVTQFDKNDIEDIGLVKFDFLGLRTLTVINHALNMINKKLIKNNKKLVNINNLKLDDTRIFYFLQTAQTLGIFQLESRGIKELIKQLKPDNFEDLIALLALFRPGPLQSGMVENFINRKHGKEIISYPDKNWQHEKLKPILQSTYGIILYQEQVMKIAQVLAGYSLGEADILRRVISKKQHKEMGRQRKRFLYGSNKLKINNILSMKIFDYLEKFASYGFNKSHSAGYALISYQTLWLKLYYPAEFMAAVLTSEMDNTNKTISLINECKNLKINVLPPNINNSLYKFHVDKYNNIIYGLGAIKGIGEQQAYNILNARKQKGYFKSIFDFFTKINFKKINKRIMEVLILSGSLDCFNFNRGLLINYLEKIIKIINKYLEEKQTGQINFFNENNKILLKDNEYIHNDINLFWAKKDILIKEKNILGCYLTEHPLNGYLKEILFYTKENNIKNILRNYKKNSKLPIRITIGGIISNIRTFYNKKKEKYLSFNLDDSSNIIEVHLSLDIINNKNNIVILNNIILINGILYFNNLLKLFICNANSIMNITIARDKYLNNINIIFINKKILQNILFFKNLKKFLFLKKKKNKKNIQIYFFYENLGIKNRIYYNKSYFIYNDENDFDKFISLLNDNNNIKLEFN
ncbi:DNA polymerase III subunit alpha [Enterobacteriaceae endosymbiont of Donacia thalassina]|uniref:DNA polymerase III subunit alpha n=1 Tax=Enterobacteriaceae endosymbiont of Donacia thalassina TaxID=2675786 RepID=UPI001448D038|nr:DNA polymerase III subunit alpha [Enterobacteriaceae endosymbiont of Donacia thalassina]QJC37334.1 DNA polymerase III subunit alpha [Enterobacteriaceae endosymbiont of Donacia thalassina]